MLARVLAFWLVLAIGLPSAAVAQPAPSPTYDVTSTFVTPSLPDTGPLDQVLQIVNLEPGAATPIHFHDGPGFATILAGEVTHHRFALDRDTVYGVGDTWVELPEDVHYARNEGGVPATILATFVLPRPAANSVATDDQLDPSPPEPTVPVIARVPVEERRDGYAVTQLVRTIPPFGSMPSWAELGTQVLSLVVDGQLIEQRGNDLREMGVGDYWVETPLDASVVFNPTSSPATIVMSELAELP